MAQTIQLPRNSQPVEVDGIRITAPALQGSITWRAPSEHRAMLAEAAPSDLERAIAEANLRDGGSLEINADVPNREGFVRTTPSAVAPDEIQIETALPENEPQFAIFQDESGLISLHFSAPLPVSSMAELSTGARPNHYFRIPLRQAEPRLKVFPHMALLGGIVSKVIRFFSPSKLAGDAVFEAARFWEDHYRPEGFHGGADFDALFNEPTTPVDNWQLINGRKALLFIHGTISSTAEAFGGLKKFPSQLAKLYAKYNNCVIGFNHHTLTKSVCCNVTNFFAKIPDGNYQFDVISHSRGGLVARTLKTSLGCGKFVPRSGVSVHIGKVMLVGTPDIGTPLADPGDLAKAVSILASIATAFPQAIACIGLGALLAIAGGIVAGGLKGLPGLQDMYAHSAFLQQLNSSGLVTDYFGIAADFVASGNLLKAITDDGFNALFLGNANDLVVPTLGVYKVNGRTLPVDQTLEFSKSPNSGVCHTTYFSQQQTIDALVKFLT